MSSWSKKTKVPQNRLNANLLTPKDMVWMFWLQVGANPPVCEQSCIYREKCKNGSAPNHSCAPNSRNFLPLLHREHGETCEKFCQVNWSDEAQRKHQVSLHPSITCGSKTFFFSEMSGVYCDKERENKCKFILPSKLAGNEEKIKCKNLQEWTDKIHGLLLAYVLPLCL